MARLVLPPYLCLSHHHRSAKGFELVMRIRRWHPAWWQLCWNTAAASGLEWWGPTTWAAVLWMIVHGPSEE